MAAWDGQRWHAATAELERLLELSAESRAARLAALQDRDPALAADVARLMDNERAADAAGFLDGQAAELLTTTSGAAAGGVARPGLPTTPALAAGTRFGPYRILRVLGRGGMGVVYEAEESESGRRVALKVLQERLTDEHERERFDREGRLAASLDHEHCVFVFGAAEIGGVPSIAMELMHGTLADRVTSEGPMLPAAAVDAALQLVAGLEAAAAAGILHRDVKPSNCFVDTDGVIKIGDFGISRSMRPTEETALATRGRPAATPTYASPEQLRGAALDVRADIYSLGATLYELLTGVRPFTGSDLMALLMAVANDTPKPPHAIVPTIPAGLSRVVLRCLAKQPGDRYASYDALAAALEPYTSAAATPATLGRRLVAGGLDQMALSLLAMPILLSLLPLEEFMSRPVVGWHTVASYLPVVLYYGGLESLFAATPGKALFGLTVVDAGGRPARAVASLFRAAIFGAVYAVEGALLIACLHWDVGGLVSSGSPFVVVFQMAGHVLVLAVLFSTARRHNGYAALHDLATRTRIVERRARVRMASRAADPRPLSEPRPAVETRGPFAVVEGTIEGRPGWRPGLDSRLRRPVWVHDLAVGTAPLAPQRAALARPTRLRWLAGRRTDREAWDIYEDVAGVPLAQACGTLRQWGEVRRWLLDLAHELAAQGPGDRPPLDVDRVWILESGRAKLLDNPTSDAARVEDGEAAARALLADVARLARMSARGPWPVAAERFRGRLAAPPSVEIAASVTELEELSRRPVAAARSRRALSMATQMACPVLLTAMMVGGMLFVINLMGRISPDERATMDALYELSRAERGRSTLSAEDRQALEVVLAARYRATLSNPRFNQQRMPLLTPKHKAIADAILRRDGPDTKSAEAEARPAVRAIIEPHATPDAALPFVALLACFGAFLVAACGALVTALVSRGSVLRLLGFEIVTADGLPASRGRVLARTAIAWSPILGPSIVSTVNRGLPAAVHWLMAVVAIALLLMLVGAVVAVVSPQRGLQDRLARTWLVPR